MSWRDIPNNALAALTARQRAIVVLRFYEDRSVLETADILGKSAGAVKQLQRRGLLVLRSIVDREEVAR